FLPMSFIHEPTADINATLGMGLLGMIVATYCGIRAKGILGYFMELLGPLFDQEDATGSAAVMGKLSALFFFPLNVIGEIAKVVSISFRIFGNILGGSIIMIVISTLIYSFTPMLIGMNLFFVFFVGTVHAFVFAMLTLTYIAVAIK
ncbi:MAG: F0F1 ATP synthase subunit A, partial [Candidatus Hydrogenedentes bacterium]|nr:F0F1 ATP synthase subunit A [Candidatus Hydrogenedentota bacterium]